jgi:hypothetical protein
MGQFQMHEVLLTAAQSLLAVVMLACLRFTLANALLLFALFIGQLVVPSIVDRYPQTVFHLGLSAERVHLFFSVLYVMGAVSVFLERPRQMWSLWKSVGVGGASEAVAGTAEKAIDNATPQNADLDLKTPHCLKCQWRLSGVKAVLSESQERIPGR